MNTLLTRYGISLDVVTDRDRQFECELLLKLSKIIGFCRLRSAVYHHQSHGLTEITPRTIKIAIIADKETLLFVFLKIHSKPNESGFPFTTALPY